MNLHGTNYKLVWEDHFDTELDPGYWDIKEYFVDGHEGRKAWRKREALSIENSNLVIRGYIDDNGDYVSGMIRSDKSFVFKYGYAEIRAKLPKSGKGIWPGFWMTNPNSTHPEIDVFEMFGDSSKIDCAMHFWWYDSIYKTRHHISYNMGERKQSTRRLPDGKLYSDDYHTIGLEWTPELMQFCVDGEPYCTRRIDNPVFAGFHTPVDFIISMAYGLPYLSAPEYNGEPAEYYIDYVRLYQNEDGKVYKIGENNEFIEIDSIYSLKNH